MYYEMCVCVCFVYWVYTIFDEMENMICGRFSTDISLKECCSEVHQFKYIRNMRRIGISISDSRGYITLRLMNNWNCIATLYWYRDFLSFFMLRKSEIIVNDESVMCESATQLWNRRGLLDQSWFVGTYSWLLYPIFRNLMNLFKMTQLNHCSQACLWLYAITIDQMDGQILGKYNVHFWMKLRERTDIQPLSLPVIFANRLRCLIDGLSFH